MRQMPRTRAPDSSLSLLLEGYEFISRRCRRLDTDTFETRLLLRPAICMQGRDAAEVFYDPTRFQRAGAPPRRLRKTLFGRGGVQTLDDEAHRDRKRMLLSVLSPERMEGMVATFADRLADRLPAWEQAGRVVLHDEMGLVLTESVHVWAGVPLEEAELPRRVRDLHGMIRGGAGVGPLYLWGRCSRQREERRLGRMVEQVRAGRLEVSEERALHVVAWHHGLDGELLDSRTAAVELLNVLRPTMAVDRFIVFAALALHERPAWRERLGHGDVDDRRRFVNEVRRYYPFFPFVAARVREEFTWRGYRFPRGRRVLLDLFGTDRDSRLWGDATAFRPGRFEPGTDTGNPHDLIPQGGGDHLRGHRCPGEWLTIELMCVAVESLIDRVQYRVPPQDLRIARGRLPAWPRSGMVIDEVRRVDGSAVAASAG